MLATPFSAVLLAAGHSTRMGRDKALLEVDGRPLWQRQWDLLAEAGASERFLSVRTEQSWAPADATKVADVAPGAGPLAGIVAALERCSTPLLLVLAVDLPGMQAVYLRKLHERCGPARGVVPWRRGGRPEPLCAIYPREGLAAARELLAGGHHAVTGLAATAGSLGLIRTLAIEAEDEPLFVNWNSPDDAPRD
ncbi:MAG: molybdenum cofactor guanylyltransferase [Opitutae bacterium]|nr:molybdenum cofactor guanylyltransferase [Opitutae bacterium]